MMRMLSCLVVALLVVGSGVAWAAGAYAISNNHKNFEQENILLPFKATEPKEANESVCSVTLVTGDVVIVSILPDGKRGFAIKPADSTKLRQNFRIFETPKGTYLFPAGIDLRKVDKELFNIDYLVREQYCNLAYLPVLIDYNNKEEKRLGAAEQKELEKEVNITIIKSYHSIPTFSAKLSFEGINKTFKTLVERPEIKKIWLDKKVKASLYESVPLIGAPELWKSGYNGSGLEIAILDTGIDDTHPDLDDIDDNPATFDPKVIVKKDFTDDDTTEDLCGHGTHCAGIAAGTGVAPSKLYPTPIPVPVLTSSLPTSTQTPPNSLAHSLHSTQTDAYAIKVNNSMIGKERAYTSINTTPDAYEPDDNYWLANWIPTNGTKQLHDFHVPGDPDYVKFNATDDERYLIETSDLGYEADTYMCLYDADGFTEITHDDDSGEGLASRIIWKCDDPGTYYVKVRHFSSSASGPNTYYNISVLEGYSPPAEFSDIYSDYREDTNGDGLYDYLVVEVGVNVTKAGRYQVSGELYENGTYSSVDYAYNATYLSEGNQTVQLRFEGIRLRQSKYNGTYDLRYLELYNAFYPIPPMSPLVISSERGLEETIERGEIAPENVSAMYVGELDYRRYAYTTSYYNYTDFQRPPAEFTDLYSDYGEDTDGDGLYDYLVVEVGVNVTKAGRYQVSGELWENGTYNRYNRVDYTTKSAHLSEGDHTIKLKFSGIEIRNNGYNGTYDLKYLCLYNPTYHKLDYRYYACTTSHYNYTDFQEFPRYIGVAPGAYLWNVKVLNQYGMGYESWIIDGIEYAAYGSDGIANTGDEADIISMSLGGIPTDGTDPLSQAVNNAVDQGLVVAVAAGNSGSDYFTVDSPGVAEKVITVGASAKEDYLAGFSSRGPTLDLRVKPDILAPGAGIIAPRASGTSMGYPYNDYYTRASGTSMATPHVAGAAALILQVHPDWTPEEVKNALISTAEDLGYNVYQQGGGRIDIPSAANSKILVDPATINFKSLDTTNGTITFKNLDTVSHTLTLDVSVREVLNDMQVDCAHLNRTSLSIAPGSSASVLLMINATSLPNSLYSGKVSATYSGGELHSVFGFSILNKVTVNKINMEGEPAISDPVVIFSDVEDAWEKRMVQDGITDENGTVTFYLPNGTYNVISSGQIAVMCVVEEVVYKGDVMNPEETLNLLREFRDIALKDKYVALYYEYSPDIRAVLIEEPRLLLEAAKLITKYKPAVKYVLGKEGGKDLQMDKKEVEKITSFTNKLKEAIKERETQIGAERSYEMIKSIEELEEQIKSSEGKMFSKALGDSNYSQNNTVVNRKAGKEAGEKEEPMDASVYTINESLTIESDMNITLDERETYVIDFDYNKTEQTMSEKFDEVYYQGNVSVMFASQRSYPNETRTYITPTNSFKSIFIYTYYPEEYYNESNRWLINAPEWHKLLYNLSGVTENVTFVADYDKLVERTTDYQVALKPEPASWWYDAWHPDMWLSITSIYEMNAPLHRIEWLSSSPVSYIRGYEQNESRPDWSYHIPERSYPAGSKPYFAVGGHPFKSGVKIDILWKGSMDIYGTISEDTFGNGFANHSCNVSGNLTVIKDGEVIIDHKDIWDHFQRYVYFSGTPGFNIILQGNSGHGLSTYTRTELNFTADPTSDYQPPRITMRASGSDLNNTVPGGDVKVEMDVEDDSKISDATLGYSLDNGSTWNLTTPVYKGIMGCKPISGGNRTVVDETYTSPIYSKVKIFMDDTEDNDEIYYSYIFTLKKSNGSEYTKIGASTSTLGDIYDILYYDEDNDGELDLFKSIYIGAYTEDDDTLDVKVEGWNGTVWKCLYGKKIRRYEADLGYMNNTFVSLRANATDSEGNSVSQTVIKGFYVSDAEECIPSNTSWNVTISATNQLEPVAVGMHPNATDGYDPEFDVFAQTPVQGKVILLLDEIYSESIKKTRCYNESVSWNLSVGVPAGQTTNLSWDVPSNVNLTISEGDEVLSPGSQLGEGSHELTVTAELLESQGFSINLSAGWNMVSLPLIPDNSSLYAVFGSIPTLDTMPVVTWEAPSFVVVEEIEPKIGYWVFTPSDTTIRVMGKPITNTTLILKAGWNMVGTVGVGNLSISDIPNQVPERPAVTWVAPSFVETDMIEPGKSAWVFVTTDTTVTRGKTTSTVLKTEVVPMIMNTKSITSAKTEAWNLTISATNQLEPVTFGIHPDATNGYDLEYDVFAQTPVRGTVIMILDDMYSKEINHDKPIWNLSIGVPKGLTTNLTWNSSLIPNDVKLTIRGVDMKLENNMMLEEGSHELSIVASEDHSPIAFLH
ncbi:MAG: S8 family serine peptidase [Methanosarcinales archaeon]